MKPGGHQALPIRAVSPETPGAEAERANRTERGARLRGHGVPAGVLHQLGGVSRVKRCGRGGAQPGPPIHGAAGLFARQSGA